MNTHPYEGGIHPVVKPSAPSPSMTDTQRLFAVLGTLSFLTALIVTNVCMTIRSLCIGEHGQAVAYGVAALAGFLFLFVVDYPG